MLREIGSLQEQRRRTRMSVWNRQEMCANLWTLPAASGHTNTPVLAIDGVAVSRCVNHGQTKLDSPLFYLHSRCLNLYGSLNLLCEVKVQKRAEPCNIHHREAFRVTSKSNTPNLSQILSSRDILNIPACVRVHTCSTRDVTFRVEVSEKQAVYKCRFTQTRLP